MAAYELQLRQFRLSMSQSQRGSLVDIQLSFLAKINIRYCCDPPTG